MFADYCFVYWGNANWYVPFWLNRPWLRAGDNPSALAQWLATAFLASLGPTLVVSNTVVKALPSRRMRKSPLWESSLLFSCAWMFYLPFGKGKKEVGHKRMKTARTKHALGGTERPKAGTVRSENKQLCKTISEIVLPSKFDSALEILTVFTHWILSVVPEPFNPYYCSQ